MEKRLRSPNYPALSLPEAIEKITTFYGKMHNHGAPRDVAARALGYSGLNGASATAISALRKYGLLEREGEEVKVSERARRIMTPLSDEERMAAIREAAIDPPLFAELAEKFPGKAPPDDLLKNYLSRKGFAPSALAGVVLAYRQTSDMVGGVMGPYDSGIPTDENPPMTPPPVLAQSAPRAQSSPPPQVVENTKLERSLGRYDFEGNSYVRMAASPDVDTATALDMLETLIGLKRAELARKAAVANAAGERPNRETENNDGDAA